MDRYLSKAIREDLTSRIVILTGPRQCGKTTLSKMLLDDYDYLNHDLAEHRLLFHDKAWDRNRPLVIFDELHKMPDWKSWLKGVYDVEGIPPAMVVTGSARLNAFRKVGDSLAGRHFNFRLHPLDLKEALAFTNAAPGEAYEQLLKVGGFPEPYLAGTRRFYNRWKRSHIDLILKEDLTTLTAVRDIQSIETLIELLRRRVGSPVSANSLARDLQKSPTTIQNWLQLLVDLYVIFRVSPYHKNIARALLKEPKYYFYDNAMVEGDEGARLENLVACALLKEAQRAVDVEGADYDLQYIRDKEGRETDFLLTNQSKPYSLVEVKWSDEKPSAHFSRFLSDLHIQRTQVVGTMHRARSYPNGLRVEPAIEYLANLTLPGVDN